MLKHKCGMIEINVILKNRYKSTPLSDWTEIKEKKIMTKVTRNSPSSNYWKTVAQESLAYISAQYDNDPHCLIKCLLNP